jgi:hypothetical protein
LILNDIDLITQFEFLKKAFAFFISYPGFQPLCGSVLSALPLNLDYEVEVHCFVPSSVIGKPISMQLIRGETAHFNFVIEDYFSRSVKQRLKSGVADGADYFCALALWIEKRNRQKTELFKSREPAERDGS